MILGMSELKKDIEESARRVGRLGKSLISIYLLGLSLAGLYLLYISWNNIYTENLSQTKEASLLGLVILSGALGSLIHSLRSFLWYLGNRNLVRSWVLRILFQPLLGALISVIFYFVLRGGLFSEQAEVASTSPFGFCAVAGLVGLFSEQAVLKLKQIAEDIFTKPSKGEDSSPQGN